MIRAAYTDTDRNRIRAFVSAPPGPVGTVLGEAVRIGPARWAVVILGAKRPRYRFRRRSALRLLKSMAAQHLGATLARERLGDYRPGFDDRLRAERGWR